MRVIWILTFSIRTFVYSPSHVSDVMGPVCDTVTSILSPSSNIFRDVRTTGVADDGSDALLETTMLNIPPSSPSVDTVATAVIQLLAWIGNARTSVLPMAPLFSRSPVQGSATPALVNTTVAYSDGRCRSLRLDLTAPSLPSERACNGPATRGTCIRILSPYSWQVTIMAPPNLFSSMSCSDMFEIWADIFNHFWSVIVQCTTPRPNTTCSTPL